MTVNGVQPAKILLVILPENIDKNLFACIIQAMIIEIFLYGFISAFGWWSATHYVIEPHFPPPIEKKAEKQLEKSK